MEISHLKVYAIPVIQMRQFGLGIPSRHRDPADHLVILINTQFRYIAHLYMTQIFPIDIQFFARLAPDWITLGQVAHPLWKKLLLMMHEGKLDSYLLAQPESSHLVSSAPLYQRFQNID